MSNNVIMYVRSVDEPIAVSMPMSRPALVGRFALVPSL